VETLMPRQGSRAAREGEDYQAMLDRHASQSPVRARETALPPDVDYRSIAASAAPFSLSERAFQSQVVRYARLAGWAVYHTYDSRRSQPGFPDLVLVRRPRIVWAELKSQRGKVTTEQQAWIDELRACDQEVHVWRPSDWRTVERVLR
jgi:hypothetical protein